jgi:UDP-N-acetylmuramoyl-L-alanyl-D-glutamate--2,6-diaminopimelate ligase
LYSGHDVQLTKLTEKTDEVAPGACFVARVRRNSDGHPYIGKAIRNGASMILAQRSPSQLGIEIPRDIPFVQVADTAASLAWLAAAWEGFPSRHLVMIGITGTDGKSSTANILYEVLKEAGLSAGLLSTTRAVIGPDEEPLALHVTTPEAPVVQRHLRRMVEAGMSVCILETTSHGLAQHRVTAVAFDVAVLTNITHEHLDEHGDFQGYVAAKSRLFESLVGEGGLGAKAAFRGAGAVKTAVLNRDDPSFKRLGRYPYPKLVTYGLEQDADVSATNIVYGADKTSFTLRLGAESGEGESARQVDVASPMPGEFTVYNMMAAAAVADHLAVPSEVIGRGLRSVRGVEGRMQRIERGQEFVAIVDFAHTPNALTKAIAAARKMVEGKVITVFGSAGKRDVQKRRLMAEVSARHADLTVLTAEDPRDESLDEILAAMAEGCTSLGGVEGVTFWRVPDRGRAIYYALRLARPDDIVLICGKGHEQSMCFGTTEFPWDDRDAAVAALEAISREQPMADLGLPTFRYS